VLRGTDGRQGVVIAAEGHKGTTIAAYLAK